MACRINRDRNRGISDLFFYDAIFTGQRVGIQPDRFFGTIRILLLVGMFVGHHRE